MYTVALKLLLTPILIGLATLAGRRWGPAVSGSLIGLPLTSGPIAFVLALTHGTSFAASSATAMMFATLSLVAYSLAYTWLAERGGWQLPLAAGYLAFAMVIAVLQSVGLQAWPMVIVVVLCLVLALRIMPLGSSVAEEATTPRAWDVPARMVAATLIVLLLTGIASSLGPRLTGLLSSFPVYAAIMAVFAQRQCGPAGAQLLLRGMTAGLFGCVGFHFSLAMLLKPLGIAPAFLVALIAALALQGCSLAIMRQVPAEPDTALLTPSAGAHS